MNENPEIAEKLRSCNKEKQGRPRLEETQPGLLEAIIQIVSTDASADEKRRTETLRTCQNLSSLQTELQRQ
ncbi:unnamed protein product, partial [Allacma fusca]